MITYTCTNIDCNNKVVAKHNLKITCKCGSQMYSKHGIIDNDRRTPKSKRNKGFPYCKSSGKDKTRGRGVSDDFKGKGGKE